MKNNKLSLKALKAELDLIKSSKGSKKPATTETHKSSVAHDIKNSYIQNLHMKSSMFMLWLVTAVLSYGHKIPFIKQIIGILSLWYSKTTIWKILIKLRKAFILFNAAIGVFMVFNTVGFTFDNILAGFAGMGHNYLEIFTNFTKRLFNWFVELFDHKVVPNVPGDTPKGTSGGPFWTPRGIESNSYYPNYYPNPENSLRKSYNSLLNIQVEPTPTSWYSNLSTWLWIGGSIFVVYLGYKFIVDPLFIANLWNPEGTSAGDAPTVQTVNPNTSSDGSITPTEGSIAYVTKSIVKGISKSIKKLNPSYWFLTSTDTEADKATFYLLQTTADKLNEYYPYTSINPYDSWIKRMRLSWLGETSAEMIDRKALARSYLNAMTEHIRAPEVTVASTSTLPVTPSVATIGLGLNMGDTGFLQVSEKILSLPSTPGLKPLTHLMTEDLPNPFAPNPLDSAVGRLRSLPFTDDLDDVVERVATPVQSYARVVSNNGKHN